MAMPRSPALLESMSAPMRWLLVCVIVPSAIGLLLLIPRWTIGATVVMCVFETAMVLLVLGLCAPVRFRWALRGVGFMIFLLFAMYLIDQIMSPRAPAQAGGGSTTSVWNALAGLIVFGIPSLWYTIRPSGRRSDRDEEEIDAMPLLIATSNEHKVHEIREILDPLGLELVSLADIRLGDDTPGEEIPEPVEDADTFEGNAAIKALYYAAATGMVCLADDSGLEVDALGGRPGVYSARYAGVDGSRAERDAANNAKLLRELEGVPEAQRTARFVCAMALADPEGNILATTRGTFEGRIGFVARGANGFGYDPLLVLEDGRTSAELAPEEKNGRSHRGAAARAMAEKIG